MNFNSGALVCLSGVLSGIGVTWRAIQVLNESNFETPTKYKNGFKFSTIVEWYDRRSTIFRFWGAFIEIAKIGIWVKEKNQMWLLDQEYGLDGSEWLFYSLVVSLLVSFPSDYDRKSPFFDRKLTGNNKCTSALSSRLIQRRHYSLQIPSPHLSSRYTEYL